MNEIVPDEEAVQELVACFLSEEEEEDGHRQLTSSRSFQN